MPITKLVPTVITSPKLCWVSSSPTYTVLCKGTDKGTPKLRSVTFSPQSILYVSKSKVQARILLAQLS